MNPAQSKLIRLWLWGFLFIGTNYFHIIRVNVDYRDILLTFSVFILGLYTLLNAKDIKNISYKNSIVAFFPLFMCILASIIPVFIFNQSFGKAFFAQRPFYLTFLCYFPIRMAFMKNDLTFDYVKRNANFFATIELIIVFIQCLLRNQITFTTLEFSNFVKYGASTGRLWFDGPIIIFSLFFWISDFLKGKKKYINLLKIVMSLYIFFVFSQTRMMMLGLAFIILMALLIYKGNTLRKLLIIFLVLPLLIYLFVKSNYWVMISSAFNGSLVNTQYDTTTIRRYARELYISGFLKSYLMGMGYPHESCVAAYEAAGFYRHIFLVDNGFWGFLYVYGIFGIYYYYIVYVRSFFRAIKLYKVDNKIYYLLYFSYLIITSFSLMSFNIYEIPGFSLLLIICMMEEDSFNLKLNGV
ncbi:MAG: hypothetical protein PUF79_05760 [Lactobacillaceae bacterium]|nr:hypothetical protein [Lactobacillaceae bacterium]